MRLFHKYNTAVWKYLDKPIKARAVKRQVCFMQIIFYTWSSPGSALQTHRHGSCWKTYDEQHAEASSPPARQQSVAAEGAGDTERCPKQGSNTKVVEDAPSHHISTTQGRKMCKTARVKRTLIICMRGKCFPKESYSIHASAVAFPPRSRNLLKSIFCEKSPRSTKYLNTFTRSGD